MRRHLTFVLSEASIPRVAALRHRWDPTMAAGVPPHITLVYPEEVRDEELLLVRAATAAAAVAPFEWSFGSVIRMSDDGGAIAVAATAGSESWDRLRDLLLASPQRPWPCRAHVTIVHPRTSSALDAAWLELSDERPFTSSVTSTSFALTSTGERMEILRRFELGESGDAVTARGSSRRR